MPRKNINIVNRALPVIIGIILFTSGYALGFLGFKVNLFLNPPKIEVLNKTPSKQQLDFSFFWEVFDVLDSDYLFQPLNVEKLLFGATSGLVDSLGDPYTVFLTPEENTAFEQALEGTYEGIGAEIGIRDNQLMIVAPLDGSPAQSQGVRAGDKILKISGEDTSGMSIQEAVMRIRGDEGTVVTLTLKRGEAEAFDVAITRAKITIPSVEWEDEGNGVYYIRLSRFGSDTTGEWDSAVAEVKSQKAEVKSIVLDMRSNPGGFLGGAVYVASEFVSPGTVVVKQEDQNGAVRGFKADKTANGNAFSAKGGLKVVVLIDGGSASASEIVSGALQELRGAPLVGKTSFGKGTIQDVKDVGSEGAGLHVTVAKWLTPNGVWVDGRGLAVDYEVELTDEDINEDRDPQLDKALELAR